MSRAMILEPNIDLQGNLAMALQQILLQYAHLVVSNQ